MADERRSTILLVEGDPAVRARVAAALAAHVVVEAYDAVDALAKLGTARVDLVLTSYRLPDGDDGLKLLREVRTRAPDARRLLLCDYHEFPEVIRARVSGLVARVMQRSARAEHLARIVGEAQGLLQETVASGDARAPEEGRFGWLELEQLMLETATQLTQLPGVVVRQLSPQPSDLQIQCVLPAGPAYEGLRGEVLKRWLWPLKPRGNTVPPAERDHPVVKFLGDLAIDHEVYARRLDDDPEVYVYLALLPWRKQARVTAVLGLVRPRFLEILRQLVIKVHRFAVEEVAELPLPSLPPRAEATGPGQTALEYDWIVTDSYVGPDRRDAPTSLFNRFLLFGRRKRVPGSIAAVSPSFVDRQAPWVRKLLVIYVALALVDTLATLWWVRSGTVVELNPLLRPLVLRHPLWFLVSKNAASLAVFLVVARFQLHRAGRVLVGATVAAYASLDLYWLVVIGSAVLH